MAPQVTIYFHKLSVTSSTQGGKKNRYLATFSIKWAPISCRVPKPVENVKIPKPIRRARREKGVKDVPKVPKTAQALRSKAAKGFKKRQVGAMKRSVLCTGMVLKVGHAAWGEGEATGDKLHLGFWTNGDRHACEAICW
uniref:Uncharacterized protein n=1 Tax=Cannabis sativa TaxID=3483 RepID=A0A803PTT9_CANSA